ncbi:unnamed protein product [Hyaloperonospora brassicae]|uniref:FYVE-type domain-containing protein n=1 Tax=Hyaloperonospora brassicae TaxID=162125 RepID=A0AAV0STX4_HYABA|nr:unnamed protein product [Hyaloperonospora brassicae]
MSAVTFSRVEAHALAARNAAPKQRLPLRRNHFGRVQPSQDDVRLYLMTATSLLHSALSKARADRASGHAAYRTWKQLSTASSRIQRLTKIDANGRDVHYRLQGTIVGASVQDLMGVLSADATTAQVVARRRLLSSNSLDAQTLCVLRDRRVASTTATYDHLSLRWEAIRLSPNSPIYDRDRCYLEFTGVTTDVDGTLVGFLIQHAIAHPNCGSLLESHGLTRLDVTEVVLLRPSSVSSVSSLQGMGCTDMTLDGLVRRPSKFPPWLVHSYLSTVATCLDELPNVVQERLLATLPVLSTSQCVSRASRRHCHVCRSAFGLWSKKVNCRSCGDVACKSCVVTRTGGETATFCTKCLTRVSRETAKAAVRLPSDCDSASFTTSSSCSDCRSSCRESENGPCTSTTATAAATTSLTSMQRKGSAMPTPRRVRINTALLEDSGDSRRLCSTASTASESSSLDSSSWDCCSREGSLLDDDVDETLDTKQMLRSGGGNAPACGSSGQSSRQVPTGRAVDDLIAHQRYLLQEMLSQARAYHHQWARA